MRDFFLKYQNIFFYFVLEKGLVGCKSVLDVGCGHNSAVGAIRKTFKSEGIDIFKKTVELSKRKKNHDKYKVGDITKLDQFYKPNSFDACVSIDVIEHFDHKDALKLIKKMEQVAKKKVIILTPNGFYEQHDFDGNPHQEHKSGWKKKQLEELGYKVYGLRGLKYLRNDHAGIKFKPWIFWGFIAFISEILFYPFPSLSFDIYAVKDINRKTK
jgi:SAM-dependent methyltransferase